MKHSLLLWVLLCIQSINTKVRLIEPLHKNGAYRSLIIDSETGIALEAPELESFECNLLRDKLLSYDNRYKIGVVCQPLEAIQEIGQTSFLDISHLSVLAYLRDTSLYTYDEFELSSIPEEVTLNKFSAEITRSKKFVHASIECLDTVITNQLEIANLALSLNKEVWFIQEATTPLVQTVQEKLHVVTSSENNCNVASIMHGIMRHKKKVQAHHITTEIPIGELIDKITILEIKSERIDDPKKLENIRCELHALRFSFDEAIDPTSELEQLIQELKAANEALWVTEDLIRDKEMTGCFDAEFIELARSIYLQNDARYRAKRTINELLGSRLIEEKSYKQYK